MATRGPLSDDRMNWLRSGPERDLRTLRADALVREFGDSCFAVRRPGEVVGYLAGYLAGYLIGSATVAETVPAHPPRRALKAHPIH